VGFDLFMEGREAPAANGARFERRNPISNALVSTAAAATAKDACAAVDSAVAAFASSCKTGPELQSRPCGMKRADTFVTLSPALRSREKRP
jgi:acyl-CoA reductase-like NAD-dependent aldehyde dehydrogenase